MKNKLHSFSLHVDSSEAVIKSLEFGELAGISKASQGKNFNKWTKADQQLWDRNLRQKVSSLTSISIRYLSSENAFFVRPQDINPYFVELETKSNLYRQILLGKELGERVELRIYFRSVETLGWCITVAIYHTKGELISSDDNFRILCDFPIILTQQAIKDYGKIARDLGFNIKEDLGDNSSFIDEFGDNVYTPYKLSFEKNDIVIDLN